MRTTIGLLCLAVGIVGLYGAVVAWADQPIFVNWLVADDPGDETIRNYWERAELDELDAPGLVDLGTMLYYRGFTKDALSMFQRALDLDPDLFEAWFRIGLTEHSQGKLDNARQAYQRCLKKRPGHGWCNFYLGLLEEQLGHSANAMSYYRKSFEHAPALANPKVNPEILSSKLALGAYLLVYDERRFEAELPMSYMDPRAVKKVWRQYEPTPTAALEAGAEEISAEAAESALSSQSSEPPPPPSRKPQQRPRRNPVHRVPTPTEPTPMGSDATEPTATEPTATGSDAAEGPGEAPYGTPPIGNTSDEAHLMPWWPNLSQVASALM
jgi:tetratricopeptide (TPR) repeat protein